MQYRLPILLIAAGALAASAQTAVKPAAQRSKSATGVASHAATTPTLIKVPPGVPVVKGLRKTLVTLQYQDIVVGDGPIAEPNKLYTVHYTGWLAADGHKFDSSYDHHMPEMGQDGKPVLDASGKPVLGPAQPITFPQGFGRVIPGFDQGFDGMRIGGKRRLFIPWQLAYGARGRPGPDAARPGIPPRADLIFDVELIAVKDLPAPAPPAPVGTQGAGQPHSPFGMRPGMSFQPSHPAAPPSAPATAPTPAQPTAPATTTAPAASATPQPK